MNQYIKSKNSQRQSASHPTIYHTEIRSSFESVSSFDPSLLEEDEEEFHWSVNPSKQTAVFSKH